MQPPVRTDILASDAERERTVELLREHHLAGRLTDAELEARTAEAWHARRVSALWHAVRELPLPHPPPRPEDQGATGTAAVVLGGIAACLLLLTFGFLSIVALPLAACAWTLGRRARRSGTGGRAAQTGEILGIVCTAVSVLALAGCAAIIVA